jgi:thiamine biosynthesis protein ThiS
VSAAGSRDDAAAAGAPAATADITVTVNGEERLVPAGEPLVALLAALGLDPRAVAVERNLEIVPRAALGEVTLAAGDRLEIVRFVQGG